MNPSLKTIAYYALLLGLVLLWFCACSESPAKAARTPPPMPPAAPRMAAKAFSAAPAVNSPVILRIACEEALTNLAPFRIVWLEASSDMKNWNKNSQEITNSPLWVTNKFGTKRFYSWLTTNTAPAMAFRVGAVTW